MKFISKIVKNSFFGPIIIVLIYFITPLIIINIFKISFFSKEISYIVVFIILILISEIIFSYVYKKINSEAYEKKQKIPFKNIVVEPHPNLPFVLKKKFISSVKSSKLNYPLHNQVYSSPELKTNNLGYINGVDGGRDVLIPKPKNIFRINCMGASTTQSYLQDDSGVYSYPLELEKILKAKNKVNLEVNNCGTGGYASSDILVRFLLQNIDTNPDAIVLYHAYNDIRSYLTSNFQSDYSHSRKNLGENYFKFYLGSFLPYVPLNFINCLQNKWYPQNHRYTLVESISRGDFKIENNTDLEKGLEAYRRNLQNIITICKSNKIQIILCSFCFYLYESVKNKKIHKIYKDIVIKENIILKELAEVNQIDFVDTYNLIPKTDKNFVDTVHFTPSGMKLLAAEISKKIKI